MFTSCAPTEPGPSTGALSRAVNGTADAIDPGVAIAQSILAQPSVDLPLHTTVPPQMEIFPFSVDLPPGIASYKHSTSYRRVAKRWRRYASAPLITAPPRHTSFWYSTTDWPGVTARCVRSKATAIPASAVGFSMQAASACR